MTKDVNDVAKVSKDQEGLSRRKLLSNVGKVTIGAVAAGSVIGFGAEKVLASDVNLKVNGQQVAAGAKIEKGKAIAQIRPVVEQLGGTVNWDNISKTVDVNGKAVSGGSKFPAYPWPYKKLDPEVVRKRGYENYFKGGCMYGVAASLIETLREEVGFPYTDLPVEMYKYGAGGAGGWGTLCGCLNGAGAVMNLVTKDYGGIYGELMGWYTEFSFPSKNHEAYCKFKDQVQTVAKSPLCHASVTKWASASGAKIGSDEKKDRCAKTTGDTAAKAVELLNQLMDSSFVAAYKPAEEFKECLDCHKTALDNEQGKMNCISCHDSH